MEPITQTNKMNKNEKAVPALLFGLFSIIPLIGLVLGIIGIIFACTSLFEIKKANEYGRGIATSGLLFSITGIVLKIFPMTSLVMTTTITKGEMGWLMSHIFAI